MKEVERLPQILFATFFREIEALQIKIVCLRAASSSAGEQVASLMLEHIKQLSELFRFLHHETHFAVSIHNFPTKDLKAVARVNQLRGNTNAVASRRKLPSSTFSTFSFFLTSFTSTLLPLNENDEVRATTRSPSTFASASGVLLAHAVAEIFLIFCLAEIEEWQHCDAFSLDLAGCDAAAFDFSGIIGTAGAVEERGACELEWCEKCKIPPLRQPQ